MSPDQEQNFRTGRYESLNQARWAQFLSMGIPLKDKTVFEPGAGIGDQTEWLLSQGVGHVYVQDGREDNINIIRERFGTDPRVTVIGFSNLELLTFEVPFCDLVFCWGVYYHLNDLPPLFPIMARMAKMGATIVFDYIVGNDNEVHYGYDNISTSLSQYAFRPRPETVLQMLSDIWGYGYTPKNQLSWKDPLNADQRLIAVGSHFCLGNSNLEQFKSNLLPSLT